MGAGSRLGQGRWLDGTIGLYHGKSIRGVKFEWALEGASLLLSVQNGTMLERSLIGRRMRRDCRSRSSQIGTASLCAQLSLDVDAWG